MKHTVTTLVLAIVSAFSVAAYAQQSAWSSVVGVATSSSEERLNPMLTNLTTMNSNMTDDGAGGVIICWSSLEDGKYYANAQRFDGLGNKLWIDNTSGIHVSTITSNDRRMVQCVGDDAGGAYIVWIGIDPSSHLEKHYIQHVAADGHLMWGTAGYRLSDYGSTVKALPVTYMASDMAIAKDGSGGALVVYTSYTGSQPSNPNADAHVARIHGGDGNPHFVWGPENGVLLSSSRSLYLDVNPVIGSDGSGGAYFSCVVKYQQYPWSSVDNLVQVVRFSSGGSTSFRNYPVTLDAATDGHLGFALISDASGVTVTYVDGWGYVSGSIAPKSGDGASVQSWVALHKTYGIRIRSNGWTDWGPHVLHNNSDRDQISARIARGVGGEFSMVLNDAQGSHGVFLQNVDDNGDITLNTSNHPAGVAVTGDNNNYAQVTTDNLGNALVAWTDGSKVLLQKYSGSSILWGAVIETPSGAVNPEVLYDNLGGAFVAWNSSSATTNDIYMQRVVDLDRIAYTTLSASTLDLGNIRTGTSASGSVLMRNMGKTVALQLNETESARGIANLTSPVLPVTLGAQGSVPLLIAAQPVLDGPFVDTVMVLTTDPISPEQKVVVTGTGVYPHITSDVSSLLFRTTFYNPVIIRFAVHNTGTTTLNFLDETGIEGPNADEFMTPIYYAPIPPGMTDSISVAFSPLVTEGSHNAVLRLSTDDYRTGDVLIQLTGMTYTGAPAISYAPYVNAGSVLVGTADTIHYLIRNTEEAGGPLVISSMRVIGQFDSYYSILSPALFPVVVWPGENVSVALRFAPLQDSGVPAMLCLWSNANALEQAIPIDGFGLSSYLAAMPLDFAKTDLEECSTRMMQVTNYGTAPMHISSVTFAGAHAPDFSTNNAVDVTLAPGQNGAIEIRFCPQADGPRSAMATIISDNEQAATASIHGWGGLLGSLRTPTTVNYGTMATQQIVTRRLVVSNVSDVPTTIDELRFAGLGVDPFTTNFSVPFSLSPGAMVEVPVTFSAMDTGLHLDTLILHGSDSIDLRVALQVNTTTRPFVALPGTMFVDSVEVGGSITEQLYAQNVTDYTQNIARMDILGADAASYSIHSSISWPYAVDAGMSAAFPITFQPTDEATSRIYNAYIVVTFTTGDTVQIPLVGRGFSPLGIAEEHGPSTLRLAPNYPNPFSSQTELSFAMDAGGPVTILVYDMLGRIVYHSAEGRLAAGTYQRSLVLNALPDGVYTAAVSVNGVTQRQRMQIAR